MKVLATASRSNGRARHVIEGALAAFSWLAIYCAITILLGPAAWALPQYAEGDAAYRAADFRKALQIFSPLAEAGDGRAQLSLGVMYEHGQGVPRDVGVAFTWYRKAADQGIGEAQAFVGIMYARGLGVDQDDNQAAIWLRHAADHDSPRAFSLLGDMYLKGQGVPKDPTLAEMSYRKAAELYEDAVSKGDVSAKTSLAFAYSEGRGVPKDEKRAAALLQSAAEAGDRFAQFNLSYMLGHGIGVEQDKERAAEWYRRACKLSCDDFQRSFP